MAVRGWPVNLGRFAGPPGAGGDLGEGGQSAPGLFGDVLPIPMVVPERRAGGPYVGFSPVVARFTHVPRRLQVGCERDQYPWVFG